MTVTQCLKINANHPHARVRELAVLRSRRKLFANIVQVTGIAIAASLVLFSSGLGSATSPPYTGAVPVQNASFSTTGCGSWSNNHIPPTFYTSNGTGKLNITATTNSNGTCSGGTVFGNASLGISSYSYLCATSGGCTHIDTNWTMHYWIIVTGGGAGCNSLVAWTAFTNISFHFRVTAPGGAVVGTGTMPTTGVYDATAPASCQTTLAVYFPLTEALDCQAPSSGPHSACQVPNALSNGVTYTVSAYVNEQFNATLSGISAGSGAYATSMGELDLSGGQVLQTVAIW